MALVVLEGVVENGAIRLDGDIALPEHAKVYVVIPDVEGSQAQIASPRLARPERASAFAKEVMAVPADAQL